MFGTSVYALPRSIFISKDAGEAAQPVFFLLKSEVEGLLLQTSVHDEPGVYSSHLVESAPGMNKYEVTFSPDLATLDAEIVVETNDEDTPTLTIPVLVKSSSAQ